MDRKINYAAMANRLKPGENDLATLYPELAKQWCSEMNDGVTPSHVTVHSAFKAWWECDKGHKWQATVNSRTDGKTGCPYCAKGGKVIPGENDLATLYPEIAAQWCHEKNGSATPDQYKSKSSAKVWWECGVGHQWQAAIISRTSKGNGCPVCAGKVVTPGLNDLKTLYPEIAAQWCYELNGDVVPEKIAGKSSKKVWWECDKGHRWLTTVNSRTSSNRKCPYCGGQKTIVGENDLKTVHPEIAAQWCYELNGDDVPENYLPASRKAVWWECDKGHHWLAKIASRTLRFNKCPYCSGRKHMAGVNDFGTLFPDIAAEWNTERNESLKPEDFSYGSTAKVWWKCALGHEWRTSINSRTSSNRANCPFCAGVRKCRGSDI